MLFIILALLLIGLSLLIIEIIFIPGTTVVGFIGVVFSIVGIVIGYKQYGNDIGFNIMIITIASTAVAVFLSFRYEAWSRFSLKTSIDSKVNEGVLAQVQIGDEGKTKSTLRPVGKAEFTHGEYEVKTLDNYIETGTFVKIIKIENNQIIVEPTN